MNIKNEFRKLLGKRQKNTHKGDYGRVFILAGSRGLSGVCYLASMATLRSGAGLVTVGVPKCLATPLARRFTEAMTLPLPETREGTLSRLALHPIKRFLKTQNVLALGPGLSMNHETQSLVRKLVGHSDKPMVIDADGLNAFQGKADLFKKIKTSIILTPHAGEFVRVFGGKIPKTEADRKKRAAVAAKTYGVVVVLKGHHTVVASPQGKIYINQTGNPGMATGGSGDVF